MDCFVIFPEKCIEQKKIFLSEICREKKFFFETIVKFEINQKMIHELN